jgi:protein-L-isoaspartate(D-aspartate) O-methyltransferase
MGEEELRQARELMVTSQLARRGISDPRVLRAMREVPRHEFVPRRLRSLAYDDCALPIDSGQTISQPFMVAIMTELLELTGSETVLEIGTGSGYQAAVLSMLASKVYSLERLPGLTESAREKLDRLGYSGVEVVHQDGSAGLPSHAPFDRIIVTAGAPEIPTPLKEQLSEDGIIVIPVGSETSQTLIRGRKTEGKLREEYHTPCVFVPLVGEHAWKSDSRLR